MTGIEGNQLTEYNGESSSKKSFVISMLYLIVSAVKPFLEFIPRWGLSSTENEGNAECNNGKFIPRVKCRRVSIANKLKMGKNQGK